MHKPEVKVAEKRISKPKYIACKYAEVAITEVLCFIRRHKLKPVQETWNWRQETSRKERISDIWKNTRSNAFTLERGLNKSESQRQTPINLNYSTRTKQIVSHNDHNDWPGFNFRRVFREFKVRQIWETGTYRAGEYYGSVIEESSKWIE